MIDPAAALIREVFARFGRAFFGANCLEHAIANVLLYFEWLPQGRLCATRQQYEQSYDTFVAGLERVPMGKLIERLAQIPNVPEQIKNALDQCLKARNILAHHYFWQRAGHFGFPEGQRQMLNECDEYNELFQATEREIDAFLKPYHRGIGINDEIATFMCEKVIGDARSAMKLSGDLDP